jgi:transcriptional regulator with XRE-family HTH domain
MTHGTPPEGDAVQVVRLEDLGWLIRAKRHTEGLTLEQAARQSGVSSATLSRLERQWAHGVDGDFKKPSVPDTRTLAALARWLRVALDRVVEVASPPPTHEVVHREGESVPDMVEAHLRADRNLDEATAAALARTFRVAYEQFARLSTASDDRDAEAARLEDEER